MSAVNASSTAGTLPDIPSPTEPTEPMHLCDAATKLLEDLGSLRAYLAATSAEDWQLEVCRSSDGSRNCLLGHVFEWGIAQREALGALGARTQDLTDDELGNAAVQVFEELWATSYVYFGINDGRDSRYQQATARERVLAFVDDLAAGRMLTTLESMDAQMALHDLETAGGAVADDAAVLRAVTEMLQSMEQRGLLRSDELAAQLVTSELSHAWPELARAWEPRIRQIVACRGSDTTDSSAGSTQENRRTGWNADA